MLHKDVFKRYGENTISHYLFYSLLCLFISIGLAGTATTAQIAIQQNYQPSLFAGFLFCFVMPMFGVLITFSNGGPWTSFIGYNLIVVPFGLILGPLMKNYASEYIIRDIYTQTILVTCVTGTIGMYSPSVFNNKKESVLITIPGILMIPIVQFFFSTWERVTLTEIIIVTSLSLYISYYFHRASLIPRSLRNSIDITSRLYLDVITFFFNLFLTSNPKQPRSDQ